MDTIMTNRQMGISGLERIGILSSKYYLNPYYLHGFSVSQKPNFGIVLLKKKANHSCIFSVRTPNEGGGSDDNGNKFCETQLGFQPTFDEYLKAMESVRTVGDKTSIRNAKRHHLRKSSTVDGISREPFVEEVEQSLELGLEQSSHQEKNAISVEKGGSLKNSSPRIGQEGLVREKLGFRERGNRVLKGNSSTRDLGQRKLGHGGSVMDLRIETGVGEDGGDGSSKRINGRWLRESGFSRNMKHHEKSDAIQSLGSDEDLEVGGLGRNGNSTKLQKKQPTSNVLHVEARVNNLEKTNEFSGFSKRVLERTRVNVGKLGESEIKNGLTDKNGFYRKKKMVDIENNTVIHEKEFFGISKVERKMGGSTIISSMEGERSYGNQNRVRLNGGAFETGKVGYRSNKIHVRLDRDHIQAEDTGRKISLKSGKFTSGNKVFTEDVNENDLELERVAFKSFEVFTDVRDKPRIARMEMEERIQKLAKWLNGTDMNVPEWLFSKMMHNANIRFTDHSILRVIQILGTLGNWKRAIQVIEWLQSRERFKSYKSRYIYTAALDVLGKAKRPVEALNVFHSMRQDLSSYPDLAAYHCIAVTLGQAGYMKELFDVIDCMRSPPPKNFKTGVLEKWDPLLEPDIVVYNAVLNACVRRKQWEGAFWVLQQLKQRGLQPSSTTYGLVMEVMFSCEKYNLVHEFFRKVEKSSIPNSLNYKVLVNTLWREGKTDEAVIAVQDMERRGIVGSASLYYDLARCLCSAGRCQEALMQIDKICKVANKPLVVTYTGLIQSCLDVGSVQNGAYIFKEMQKFCSPNLVTCNIMLRAYLEHNRFEDAKDLFQKMLDNSNHISSKDDYKANVIPDNYTFNTMLDACIAEKKWDEFKYIYHQMLHNGYNFNAKRHLWMILEACRAGKGELLETTWKHLFQAGRAPPTPIIKERFCMKLEEDDYIEAISCITTHQTDKPHHAFSEKGWLDLFQANANRFQKDTLVRFTHELSTIVAGSDRPPRPMLLNLITSCKEFIRIHKTEAEIDPITHGRPVLPQLDTKL